MTKATGSIDIEYIGESKNIALFTIDRQEKANSYTDEMIHSFVASFNEAIANPSIKAAIITGGGNRVFCSGTDISSLSGRSYQDGLNLMSRQLFNTIADAPWPTIAAICGPAIAGGLELALACDMRICTASSSFALPEIDLGLIPAAGGIARLSALIGEAKAKEIVLFGRKIASKTALQWGVVSRISDQALDDAIALAEAVVKRDSLAIRLAKIALQSTLPPSRESTTVESISQALLYHRKTQNK